MGESRTERAIDYITKLFQGNGDGHDLAHSLRVYHNAMMIAEMEGQGEEEVIALSALLHDCDDHKLFHTENNANARSFLQEEGISEGRIEEICRNINSVSFSKNRGKVPETIEGKIVQDADRLEAIGAIGIARCFQFGGSHGRSLENSIEHFYDKLLLISKELNTPSARKMAEKRDKLMDDFLKAWGEEMNLFCLQYAAFC